MQDLNNSEIPEHLDEVNLREIYNALRESKEILAIGITLFTICGILYSLLAPQIWTSSALLTVAESSNSSFSNSSALGGLASIASLGMSNGSSLKGSRALATAQSREFFDHLVTFDSVLLNLMATKSFDNQGKQIIYDPKKYNVIEGEWVAGTKPSNWNAYKTYRKNLSVNFDPKTNFVRIAVNHKSPEFAKYFLELIIKELNLLSRNRALAQSQASLDYLYEELNSYQLNDVKLAISQLIETQLKTQMLARVKVDYALESLDKPYLAKERTSPRRKTITISAFFLGLLASAFFVLIRFFFKKNINQSS
tara:strand:+ start:1077 stop:2003 length:927 start_codon:yes stop_codon:yes gene_type:complete